MKTENRKSAQNLPRYFNNTESPTEGETTKLIHELEVHRIELEMQNEELRLASDKAEAAIEKFTRLYDFAPAGYFTINLNGTICELNLTGARMLGKERSVLINSSFKQFVTHDNLVVFNDFIRKVRKTSGKHICELRLTNPGDRTIYVHLEGIVSDDDQNCHLTAIDITKRHWAEEALKESETHLRELNATKDKFFSIISHDLRSPFSSIIGYSDQLAEQIRKKDYEGIEEYAGIIQESSWRVMDLLTNLLEWSSAQTGKIEFNPEFIEIVELIREAIALLNNAAQQKSITILLDAPHNVSVSADKAMISSVLRNLISNAIKFTNPCGIINITVNQRHYELMISVKDNGVGMKKEAIEKLFLIEGSSSTLGTLNEMGTGLGLLLCKEFIVKHGGKIWVDSKLGNGSEFHFTLPKI